MRIANAPSSRKVALCVALVTAVASTSARPQQATVGTNPNFGADTATARGWQTFQTRCAVCHGPAATGYRNAPNLLKRVGDMSLGRFMAAVLERYPQGLRAGEIADEGSAARSAWLADLQHRAAGDLSMPDWAGHAEVTARVADLYAYLRACAAAC